MQAQRDRGEFFIQGMSAKSAGADAPSGRRYRWRAAGGSVESGVPVVVGERGTGVVRAALERRDRAERAAGGTTITNIYITQPLGDTAGDRRRGRRRADAGDADARRTVPAKWRMTGIPKQPARAALARSDATRSGYPIAQGLRVPLYALAAIARADATRSNYVSGRMFATIGGIIINTGTSGVPSPPGTPTISDLSITDTLNEAPNTARCSMHFGNPQVGQRIVLHDGIAEYAAARVRRHDPARPVVTTWTRRRIRTTDLDCIDETHGLNKRKVWARYHQRARPETSRPRSRHVCTGLQPAQIDAAVVCARAR